MTRWGDGWNAALGFPPSIEMKRMQQRVSFSSVFSDAVSCLDVMSMFLFLLRGSTNMRIKLVQFV